MSTLFSGVATAMITPFYKKNIDFELLRFLIERQLNGGVHALVFLGSTAETPLLTELERETLMRFCIQTVKKRRPVGIGCGANELSEAIESAKKAEEYGADFLLCSTPARIKCTQEGLISYYSAICSSVKIPVVAYNVPSRTGVDLLAETLKKIPALAGIKDATGDIKRAEAIRFDFRERLYSGDDLLNLPVLSLGGDGMISVLANLCPKTLVALYEATKQNDFEKAALLFRRLYPLAQALSIEPNPIPVKEGLRLMGFPVGSPRLPLTRAKPKTSKKLLEILESLETEGILC